MKDKILQQCGILLYHWSAPHINSYFTIRTKRQWRINAAMFCSQQLITHALEVMQTACIISFQSESEEEMIMIATGTQKVREGSVK